LGVGASAWTAIAGTAPASPERSEAQSRPVPFYATPFEKRPSFAALSALGGLVFSDPSLSASGTTACSSCHDPAHAFGPANDLAVQRGGPDGRSSGVRAVPSLTYSQAVPRFTEHFLEDEGNDREDQGPAGGHMWDGRADTAHEQALLPLVSPSEMANAGASDVLRKIRSAPYAVRFQAGFGEHFFDDPAIALNGVLLALEVYQQTPALFYPYSSKYDAWLRGQASLSAAEERGRQVFIDPVRGNCEHCHPSRMRSGVLPQFTDFGYVALGLPRNATIPANADARYFDLGLCGPYRTDLAAHATYCGLFRTPSLRNVAERRVFYHNGLVRTLRDAVRFYAERDAHPEKWYPLDEHGMPRRFDDLPPQYRANVEMDVPFGQAPGASPAISDADVDDLVSFLDTLTDGYHPLAPPVAPTR
jgi:cytochrome c peroxidase